MTEAEEVQRHPGETFDIEGWIAGANLPTESVIVYRRPDVIAELSDLKRQIEQEERVASAERTAGQTDSTTALLREYEQLLQTFSDSRLTIYVRAIDDDERADLRVSHEERTKGWDPKKANESFGYDLLSAAITHVKPAGGEKAPVKMTPEQIMAMEKAIGNVQMKLILSARHNAQNAMPAVDADFLQRLSGGEAGAE